MSKIHTVLILCFLTLLLTACVSKNKYLELESDLVETRRQAEEGDNSLRELELKYQDLETNYKGLEDKNLKLDGRVDDLNRDLKQERSVVQQQGEVINNLEATRKKIERGLKEQIAAKEIKIEEMEGKLRVTFIDKILFNSGSARINERGKESLSDFAQSFRDSEEQSIVVEGHTDNVKLGAALQNRYPSNWELSTARATAVVRYLQEEGSLKPEFLSATGYGYYRPVASNETEDGRSQNRRIEIILAPVR